MADKLTPARIAEFKEAFDVLDHDKDGSINVSELGSIMKSLGHDPTETELKKMIHEVDADGNGSIELAEFIAMMEKRARMLDARKDEEIKTIFQSFDRNGDGKITRKELKDTMAEMGDVLSDDEIDEMMMTADENGDGYVDEKEFANMIKSS